MERKKAILTAARSLQAADIENITARLIAQLGDIDIAVKYDDSMLGGFSLKVDGKVYDTSINTKLEQAKNELFEKAHEADGKLKFERPSIQSIKTLINNRLRPFDENDVAHIYEYGTIESASDDVVRVSGLTNRAYGELLDFGADIYGIALDVSENSVGAVLFENDDSVGVGTQVRATGNVMQVPVGEELLGRVLDPLGRPLDGKELHARDMRAIEQPAPKIIERQSVNTPLETGLLAIDSMIPIGRGQRELIIGDRQTGKTTIAIDAIINQRGKDVVCVYCAIGQKASTVAGVVETLTAAGAMPYTVIVSSTASDNAAMQYIAPYSACAMAEWFMYRGRDVLVVYDDLSKHAVAYRAMSLLLHRPPGREAYPGDVFYLHSRLLERAARLSKDLGGGSITALPIIETMAGDISAYIPTNVISITDGQIFLESELYHSGVRPAVNVGLSVSRVGRSAQHKAMQKVSKSLRIDLAQYRELAIFSQFGSDIDKATKRLLDRGERLIEILKQNKQTPRPLSAQVLLLVCFNEQVLADVATAEVAQFCKSLLEYAQEHIEAELEAIDRSGDLGDGELEVLQNCAKQFAAQYAKRG